MSSETVAKTEDPSEVAFQLLADWWMDTIQALVDLVGHAQALELLRPYYRNAHTAAAKILQASFNLNSTDPVSAAFLLKTGGDFWLRSNRFEMTVKEHGGETRIRDCPFKDGPVELCIAVCGIGVMAATEVLNPEYDIINISRLSEGAGECFWISKPKLQRLSNDLEDLGKDIAMIMPWSFPDSVIDDFSIQYLAEYWVMSTRALIDRLGGEQSELILSPYMRHRGASFGLREKSRLPISQDITSVRDTIAFLNTAFRMRGSEVVTEADIAERTISECPFKDAPPEVCRHVESFCNGACGSINPHYEFYYDKMMTKGDKTCHWTIRRKKGTELSIVQEEQSADPLRQLALKYVSGEISKEEYQELKSIISRSP